jgi:hypothetical protein
MTCRPPCGPQTAFVAEQRTRRERVVLGHDRREQRRASTTLPEAAFPGWARRGIDAMGLEIQLDLRVGERFAQSPLLLLAEVRRDQLRMHSHELQFDPSHCGVVGQ